MCLSGIDKKRNSIFSNFVNALGNFNCGIFVCDEIIETSNTTEPTENKIKAGNEIKTRVQKNYKSVERKV